MSDSLQNAISASAGNPKPQLSGAWARKSFPIYAAIFWTALTVLVGTLPLVIRAIQERKLEILSVIEIAPVIAAIAVSIALDIFLSISVRTGVLFFSSLLVIIFSIVLCLLTIASKSIELGETEHNICLAAISITVLVASIGKWFDLHYTQKKF